MAKRIIQVEDKVPVSLLAPLSVQHMFAMFGASVLVPFIFGLNPAVVLFMNGVGTLLFMFLTKGKAPAYLGSSFAFIAPVSVLIGKYGFEQGYAYALGGFVVVGFAGCVLALIIKQFGSNWIDVVLPPAAMGPVVALIGLELAGTAASTAGLFEQTSYVPVAGGEMFEKVVIPVEPTNVVIFLATLGVAVLGTVLFRGFFSVIPILIAILVGYLTTFALGQLDFTTVQNAPMFNVPNFSLPKFKAEAIVMLLPVLLVITSEHIGHQIVTSKVVGRDLIKDPGLHRSLLGDNISTMLSGLIGSVPTTTYGENIGVMAVTKVYSVRVIAGAAILSIICSFMGVLTELIKTIPSPVIGGISFLLYGMIGASGIRIMVDAKVNYGKARNLTLTSIIFVTGLSGVAINIAGIQLRGMVLACIVGMTLSLLFSIFDLLGIANDMDEKDKID